MTFNPKAVGGYKSTLVITSNDPASPLLGGLTGSGTEVETSASSINFEFISFGTTSTFKLTITNTGTATFSLTPSIKGAGFLISSTGNTCTSSLAAGKNCT